MGKKKPDVNLNLNVRGLKPSATLAINEKSNELIAQGRTVYKLGLGQSPFPVPKRVVQSLKEHSSEKDYLPVKGLKKLQEAVAHFNKRMHKIDTRPEDVLIGPGSKELIFVLQLVFYGDIIIPTPGWVSYSPQARIIGRHVHFLSASSDNKWRVTPEQLEKLCKSDPYRPRVIILNYPSNPTGCSFSSKRLEEIAAVARKYKIIIISDEIYGLLHHRGQHVSIARYYPEGTIISSGLSKWCGAGGWRLGTFSFPPNLSWLRDAMAIVASETFTSTSAPIQYAAVTAFEGGEDIEEYLMQSRRILKVIGDFMVKNLRSAKIEVEMPDGAFYLFPDFEHYRDKLAERGIQTSAGLCDAILEDTGVAMLPGEDFGREPEELTIRLAYVDFEGEKALKAVANNADKELDIKFLKKYCPKMVEATHKLTEWLNQL